MKLLKYIFIAALLGTLTGLLLKGNAIYLKPIADIYVNLIKMLALPLIFVALIANLSQLETGKVKDIAIKFIVLSTFTAFVAVLLGIGTALLFEPGKGVALGELQYLSSSPNDSQAFIHKISNIIPSNLFKSFYDDSALHVVIIAVFIAIGIHSVKDKAKPFLDVILALSEILFAIFNAIVKFSPIGIFALLAVHIGTADSGIWIGFSKLIAIILFAYFLQYLFLVGVMGILGKISPIPFMRKSVSYQIMAFTVGSSKAVLPFTLKMVQEKLGVSKKTSHIILPLSASLNMDGLSIYLAAATVFFAQAFQINLSMLDYGIIILLSTLGAAGTAGVMGGALLTLPIVLMAVGIPVESVVLIAAIDPLINSFRTMINLTGDTAITVMVDASEKNLNQDIYHS